MVGLEYKIQEFVLLLWRAMGNSWQHKADWLLKINAHALWGGLKTEGKVGEVHFFLFF